MRRNYKCYEQSPFFDMHRGCINVPNCNQFCGNQCDCQPSYCDDRFYNNYEYGNCNRPCEMPRPNCCPPLCPPCPPRPICCPSRCNNDYKLALFISGIIIGQLLD